MIELSDAQVDAVTERWGWQGVGEPEVRAAGREMILEAFDELLVPCGRSTERHPGGHATAQPALEGVARPKT